MRYAGKSCWALVVLLVVTVGSRAVAGQGDVVPRKEFTLDYTITLHNSTGPAYVVTGEAIPYFYNAQRETGKFCKECLGPIPHFAQFVPLPANISGQNRRLTINVKYNGNKPNVYRVQENLVVRLYILGCDEADVETMNKPENHMDFMLNSNGLNKNIHFGWIHPMQDAAVGMAIAINEPQFDITCPDAPPEPEPEPEEPPTESVCSESDVGFRVVVSTQRDINVDIEEGQSITYYNTTLTPASNKPEVLLAVPRLPSPLYANVRNFRMQAPSANLSDRHELVLRGYLVDCNHTDVNVEGVGYREFNITQGISAAKAQPITGFVVMYGDAEYNHTCDSVTRVPPTVTIRNETINCAYPAEWDEFNPSHGLLKGYDFCGDMGDFPMEACCCWCTDNPGQCSFGYKEDKLGEYWPANIVDVCSAELLESLAPKVVNVTICGDAAL